MADWLRLRRLAEKPFSRGGYEAIYANADGDLKHVANDGTESDLAGGGFQPVGFVLEATGIDVHSEAEHAIPWSTAYDNLWDFNDITGDLPAGFGMDLVVDGASPTFTVTEDGLWIYSLNVSESSGSDDTWSGAIGSGFDVQGGFLGVPREEDPLSTSWGTGTSKSGPIKLPVGALSHFYINTATAATNNPYNMRALLNIVRIA